MHIIKLEKQFYGELLICRLPIIAIVNGEILRRRSHTMLKHQHVQVSAIPIVEIIFSHNDFYDIRDTSTPVLQVHRKYHRSHTRPYLRMFQSAIWLLSHFLALGDRMFELCGRYSSLTIVSPPLRRRRLFR